MRSCRELPLTLDVLGENKKEKRAQRRNVADPDVQKKYGA